MFVTTKNLEIHLSHSCNLKCESCSHYSNYGHTGNLLPEQAEEWFGLWNERIKPDVFSLLGGEPTINPKLEEIIYLARKYWPGSQLRIVTNGFFLHRHPELPAAMKDAGNAALYLSIHHNSPAYLEKLQPNLELLDKWINEHKIKVHVYKSFSYWRRQYLGSGSEMEPYEDNEPRQSWEHCSARICPQIYDGKIWKCAPLAYLKMQDEKFHLSDKWNPYLKYKPLEPDCSDKELREFFSREEEHYCGMCAAKPRKFKLPLPFDLKP